MEGAFISDVIGSIEANTYQDYEIVVTDSSPHGNIEERLRNHDVHVVRTKPKVGILRGRYAAHSNCTGDIELLLDETRLLTKNALEKISNLESDMATIAEKDIGATILARLSNKDKQLIHSFYKRVRSDGSKGFFLPRAFHRRVAELGYREVKKKLTEEIFDSVVYDDHQILFYECQKFTKSISHIDEILIYHKADSTVSQIVNKYYRYGKSARILERTPYAFVSETKRHIRPPSRSFDSVPLIALMLLRGVPFFLGYHFNGLYQH